MTSYNSPIGSKKFPGQPMKDVVIPDESGVPVSSVSSRQPNLDYQLDQEALRDFNARSGNLPPVPLQPELAQVEQQFREAREAKKMNRDRLSEGGRRRIEMLIGMTRVTRTVDIEDKTYVLQTLKSRELREAVTEASAFDGSVQSPFEIRKQLLARSLVQIAGADIAQFIGSDDLSARLDVIEEFDHYLLGRLYDEYLKMVEDARSRYAVTNETDAKEVVEDLKK